MNEILRITTETLSYTTPEGLKMQGYYCRPIDAPNELSGVLVAAEWWGLSEHAKRSAERLAQAGYAALVMDVYGEGRFTSDAKQAGEWMNAVLADPAILTERTNLAFETLVAQPKVNPLSIGAIGFCFGGKVVLDMARRGVDLKAVASFHGNLTPAIPALEGFVKGEILIEHAGLDTMVSAESLEAFKREMEAAKVRYHVDVFPEAKHGFTNPQATENGEKNGVDLAYNAEAAAAAWQNMLNLLEHTL